MMAMMNPKLMISSAHPAAPVRAWAGIAGARVDSETAIGQHTAHEGGRYGVRLQNRNFGFFASLRMT